MCNKEISLAIVKVHSKKTKQNKKSDIWIRRKLSIQSVLSKIPPHPQKKKKSDFEMNKKLIQRIEVEVKKEKFSKSAFFLCYNFLYFIMCFIEI